MISVIQAQFVFMVEQLEKLLSQPVPEKLMVRIECPLPAIHLQGFLAAQDCSEKAFWRDREGDYAIAAIGYSWSEKLFSRQDLTSAFTSARKLLSHLPEHASNHCLCYLSFADDESSIWPAFGYGMVILPLLELSQTRRGVVLGVNLRSDNILEYQSSIRKALAFITALNYSPQLFQTSFTFQLESYQPDANVWYQLLGKARHAFVSGALDKVVLSRETCLKLEGQLSPLSLLYTWQQENPHSYQFLFQGQGQTFFGCSPERLVKRLENIISTEALAGTIVRGQNLLEDSRLESLLLSDRKNIHENRLVLDDICHQLQPLCQSLEADRSHSVVKLRHIQHLRYQVRGVLNHDVCDEQLLDVLHPTPAVGGTPREEALSFIETNEPYARGLYAGVCGIVGVRKSDFCVAIRSARLADNSLMLYSGAGIVKDSVADEEWFELDNKIATVLDVLDRQQSKDCNSSLMAACPGR
ncbi:isochorismate synthase MenF [Endozoicomonas sp. SCSIO W0465]|uniref:isochorismate synthase n=1 Tax=Endozoicomonas sp. SCSIO W0465 TaxID=2918516 RepID=UPI0020755042|nr:isochorismate synthase [Endozoicomonas sp. SCSIO W0465]USE34448.1 isochorismate synthase [Endozoicomonas sp. SCSIO W0465]